MIRILLAVSVLAVVSLVAGLAPSALAQDPPQSQNADVQQTALYWGELMHYALIGRWDLAQQNAQALLDSAPDPVVLLELAESDRYADSYRNLALLKADSPLAQSASEILKLIERGRYLRRTDADRIALEVRRLSGTTRGRLMAVARLTESGEWAVPGMIAALRDPERGDEAAIIRWALPQLGNPAVGPLVVVLQACRDLNIKLAVLEALGKIGYESSLPYIQEIAAASDTPSELRVAAQAALRAISEPVALAGTPAAVLFERLAQDYYYCEIPQRSASPRPRPASSLAAPANQDYANIWFWRPAEGLVHEQVPRGAFDELMTLRSCEQALRLKRDLPGAISLWLAAFFRLEAQQFPQPTYFGTQHADAATYALIAGPEHLQRVLARAMADADRAVALGAIQAMQRNAGSQSLLHQVAQRRPLIDALHYPDRQVRFSAAAAIAGALPAESFERSELVVPILAQALQQRSRQYAVVVDENQDRRNSLAAALRETGVFAEVISEFGWATAAQRAVATPGTDLILLSAELTSPTPETVLRMIGQDYRLSATPVIILADDKSRPLTENLKSVSSMVDIALVGTETGALLDLAAGILAANNAVVFDKTLADSYAGAASNLLHELALTGNDVLDVKLAQNALIGALQDERREILFTAIDTLARIDSLDAQRALAQMALDENIEMARRLAALRALARSGKTHGNLLLAEQVDQIYQIVSSGSSDSQLRSAAAETHGALNLSSVQISQLILDQMR